MSLMIFVPQARPLLEEKGTLPVDPRLENKYAGFEVHTMLHTASCCIRRDPHHRPRMSQVSFCDEKASSYVLALSDTMLCPIVDFTI